MYTGTAAYQAPTTLFPTAAPVSSFPTAFPPLTATAPSFPSAFPKAQTTTFSYGSFPSINTTPQASSAPTFPFINTTPQSSSAPAFPQAISSSSSTPAFPPMVSSASSTFSPLQTMVPPPVFPQASSSNGLPSMFSNLSLNSYGTTAPIPSAAPQVMSPTFKTLPSFPVAAPSAPLYNGLGFQAPPPVQMVPFAAVSTPFNQSAHNMFVRPGPIKLELRNYQKEWSQRILGIYKHSNIYIDTSDTGCGKTVAAIWSAMQFPQVALEGETRIPLSYLPMVVICPSTLEQQWRDETAKYGIQCITMTYESLRGTKLHPPTHGLLERFDTVSEGGRNFTRFAPTEAWQIMVNRGVMVVIDECQKAKNATVQSHAVQTLLQPVHRSKISKAALLSKTPFEGLHHAETYLRILGILTHEKLHNIDPHTKAFIPLGLQEVINYAAKADPAKTDKIVFETGMSKSKNDLLCYNLLSGPIKNLIAGAMPKPDNITGILDAKNGFYRISGENAQKLEDAVNNLSRAVGYRNGSVDSQMMSSNMGAVTKSLMSAEEAKLPDMARVSYQLLQEPNVKLIICLNYIEHMKMMAAMLSMAGIEPQILNGRVSVKKRNKIIAMFNQEDLACRILIMNPEVGGVGVNLHDRSQGGRFPRKMLISPGYKMSIIAQSAGRIYRDSTTSDAMVRTFYGLNTVALDNLNTLPVVAGTTEAERLSSLAYEMKILEAIHHKSKINYGMLDEVTQKDVKLPGDWDCDYEK